MRCTFLVSVAGSDEEVVDGSLVFARERALPQARTQQESQMGGLETLQTSNTHQNLQLGP